MTLMKRGNVWWVYFTIGGVRYQESTKTSNRRIAEEVERQLRNEVVKKQFNLHPDYDPTLTINAISEKFKGTNPAFYTLDRLKHLSPFFGSMRVAEVTKNKCLEYRNTRKVEKPKLKDATLNKDLGVLRHLLYWAVDEQLIPANPLARLPMIRERRTARPVMSVGDEEKLLAVAKPHLKDLIIAALDTGMRRGELLGQLWEHVDLVRGILFVSRSKTPEGESREIPLTERLIEILRKKSEQSGSEEPSGHVFTYAKRPILDVKTGWNSAQVKAELIRHYRFHDLRHTFNSRLMDAGVIADIRKVLMGHEDRSVHWGYTHVELPAKREAIKKLEAWRERELKALRTIKSIRA
jgi:integrase